MSEIPNNYSAENKLFYAFDNQLKKYTSQSIEVYYELLSNFGVTRVSKHRVREYDVVLLRFLYVALT